MKIKICGLNPTRDVQACIDLNVHFLGFVFYNKSPRNISLKEINILKEFLNPYSIYNESFSFTDKKIDIIITSIDQLLWKWHSPLALEWYTYLFNLIYST